MNSWTSETQHETANIKEQLSKHQPQTCAKTRCCVGTLEQALRCTAVLTRTAGRYSCAHRIASQANKQRANQQHQQSQNHERVRQRRVSRVESSRRLRAQQQPCSSASGRRNVIEQRRRVEQCSNISWQSCSGLFFIWHDATPVPSNFQPRIR